VSILLSAWLGDAGDLAALPTAVEQDRAALAWRRINDKPSSVAFRTPAGVTLSAQTVRIESDSSTSSAMSEAGKATSRKIVVFGVRNHATQANTDIKEGYRFTVGNDEYRCEAVILTLGEIQGLFEAV